MFERLLQYGIERTGSRDVVIFLSTVEICCEAGQNAR
jgi:hypothetical protein